MSTPWKASYDQARQHIKTQRHYFANKVLPNHHGFSSSHVWMWELDHKESWVPKNWCFWTVVLKKILENPLDCKEIQPAHRKGNQSWIFIGRTDAKAEAPILWPPDVKNWLIGKVPDARKDWRQEEKGMTEDEMVGWYHRLDGHEFEQAARVGDGQGSLACGSPWGCKESHMTARLNWTKGETTVHREHNPGKATTRRRYVHLHWWQEKHRANSRKINWSQKFSLGRQGCSVAERTGGRGMPIHRAWGSSKEDKWQQNEPQNLLWPPSFPPSLPSGPG